MSNQSRVTAPVFVLGSPRSGTTLLYDMLLSAGGFAVYLAESNVFNLLAPRFGDLAIPANRRQFIQAWLASKLFRASGLDSQTIEQRLLDGCRNPGDFLRLVMEQITSAQGAKRWAENSPEGVLHLPAIKRFIPEALIIHMIRDGRDVAASLAKVKYVRPFPWEEQQGVIGAGVYWEWIVQQGRAYGKSLGSDYLEVRFEDLIARPEMTLGTIGNFIEHKLDYQRIQEVAYGSVSKPNTSFKNESPGQGFSPVGRWKRAFSAEEIVKFEKIVGNTLSELGYSLSNNRSHSTIDLESRITHLIHRSYFESKLWFKNSSLVRYFRAPLTAHEIDETVLAEDHPPEIKMSVRGSTFQNGNRSCVNNDQGLVDTFGRSVIQ
jgi:sulfotransferase family protein